jgi:eukaryotic-like serine/threonine-protein kinase
MQMTTLSRLQITPNGVAYLASGQGNSAAGEFQKILDHSGIVWNCWTGALAHLGVARATPCDQEHCTGRMPMQHAKGGLAAYKVFLTLWKDADPEAKAEYAKLQ